MKQFSKDVLFLTVIGYVLIGVHCEIVYIDDGALEGTVMVSRSGVNFHAFLRIPYAEPPIDNLRFLAPVRKQAWTGMWNATYWSPICVQNTPSSADEMSEDCLYMNVFSKNLTGSMPVIVYIHGGSFAYGDAKSQAGPQYLMDREVVLVSFNYRLGALGFMAVGTREIPGNAAMKDMALVLQWVNRNIVKFGGNPNKVTLMGWSAGAIAVHALMLSPMVDGLFHRVVAISEALAGLRSLPYEYSSLALRYGERLNCPTSEIDLLIACLRDKPATDLVSISFRDHPICATTGGTFYLTIEPELGQERFLTDDPPKLFANGNFSRVPMIIGRTSEEETITAFELLNSPRLDDLNDDFNEVGPYCFGYEGGNTPKSRAISAAIKNYLPFDVIDVRSVNALVHLFGDTFTGFGQHIFVHRINQYIPVYYYKFSYVGRFSFCNNPQEKPYGVEHGDDLQYIFHLNFLNNNFPIIEHSAPENFMVERMTRMFEHFADNGNPNYNDSEVHWPVHHNETEYYLDIGTHMVEKNGLYLERYTIWSQSAALMINGSSFLVGAGCLVLMKIWSRGIGS
ncbi:esterase FE4-like [Bradysia coprophila]|uniref:esterase FE4-like n=1 Tax=Bradysia coprophila TaxID=38358 RepID=UPI00187DAF99|nr:esterase FE4-like [Bradysia coprophila]